jgi:pyruvate carboxylase
MAQAAVSFNDVFEDGDAEDVGKGPATVHRIRANSSIMQLKKILGELPSSGAPRGFQLAFGWHSNGC